EVGEAFLDPLREIRRADDVRAGLLRLACLLALREHGNALLLAGAVREHHRPAQLLVRVADVQPEIEMHLDGLVELRLRAALEQPDRLDRGVEVFAVDRAARLVVPLAVLRHYRSTSTPIDRAVPAMTSIACSTSRAFRSCIFVSAIER